MLFGGPSTPWPTVSISFYTLVRRDLDRKSAKGTRVRIPQRARRLVLRIDGHRIRHLYLVGRPGAWSGSIGWNRALRSCLNHPDAGNLQLGFLILKRQRRKRYRGSSANFKKLSSIHGTSCFELRRTKSNDKILATDTTGGIDGHFVT